MTPEPCACGSFGHELQKFDGLPGVDVYFCPDHPGILLGRWDDRHAISSYIDAVQSPLCVHVIIDAPDEKIRPLTSDASLDLFRVSYGYDIAG